MFMIARTPCLSFYTANKCGLYLILEPVIYTQHMQRKIQTDIIIKNLVSQDFNAN